MAAGLRREARGVVLQAAAGGRQRADSHRTDVGSGPGIIGVNLAVAVGPYHHFFELLAAALAQRHARFKRLA